MRRARSRRAATEPARSARQARRRRSSGSHARRHDSALGPTRGASSRAHACPRRECAHPIAPIARVAYNGSVERGSRSFLHSRRFGGPIGLRPRSERSVPAVRPAVSRGFPMPRLRLVSSQPFRRSEDRPRSVLLIAVLCIFLGGVVVGAGGRDLAQAPRPIRAVFASLLSTGAVLFVLGVTLLVFRREIVGIGAAVARRSLRKMAPFRRNGISDRRNAGERRERRAFRSPNAAAEWPAGRGLERSAGLRLIVLHCPTCDSDLRVEASWTEGHAEVLRALRERDSAAARSARARALARRASGPVGRRRRAGRGAWDPGRRRQAGRGP